MANQPRLQNIFQWEGFVFGDVNAVEFSNDGDHFAVGTRQGALLVFQASTGVVLNMTQYGPNIQPLSLAWTEGTEGREKELIIGDSDGMVSSFELTQEVRIYFTGRRPPQLTILPQNTLANLQYIPDNFDEGVNQLVARSVSAPASSRVELLVAFGDTVQVWYREYGELNHLRDQISHTYSCHR